MDLEERDGSMTGCILINLTPHLLIVLCPWLLAVTNLTTDGMFATFSE
jgi:hypothetical protein